MKLDRVWNPRRAVRFGLLAGLAAVLLWPAYVLLQEPARLWFVAALLLAAICGFSLLLFSAIDLMTVRRHRSVLPARMFDLALGALLAIPSSAALIDLLG